MHWVSVPIFNLKEMNNIKKISLFCSVLAICNLGCEKILEKKSDQRLVVPATVKDFSAMLNSFNTVTNEGASSGEMSADDYYLRDEDLNNLFYESDKRLYTWQPNFVDREINGAGDWYFAYRAIYVCNSVLYGLDENKLSGAAADDVRGQALFLRAMRYLDGVQIWSPAYRKATAANDLGMVMRLDPDPNTPAIRVSVEATYQQVISDFTEAIRLLSGTRKDYSRPTKAAAHAFLARTYLYMGDYQKALDHATEAMAVNPVLIDFNTLNAGASFPIPVVTQTSAEVVFRATMYYKGILENLNIRISPELLGHYGTNDLRRTVFFRANGDGTFGFKGGHFGGLAVNKGILSAELFLTIAECNARLGKLQEAADMLNRLLVKRWRTGAFVPFVFNDQQTALATVLLERRKELVMNGYRWSDLKRLNRDGANMTLTRTVGGQVFTLPPNDPRYAIAISETAVALGGFAQNPR